MSLPELLTAAADGDVHRLAAAAIRAAAQQITGWTPAPGPDKTASPRSAL